jgi:hypothetical protein
VGQRWLQRRSLSGGLPFAVLGGRVNFLSFLFLFFTNLQKYSLCIAIRRHLGQRYGLKA